ncbi:hypothetical protein Tco_0757688 [Tanacetum coccineum]
MEGGELTNQERESKLANEFDRFTLEKGETIQLYFMRYSKLINDINIIVLNMTKLQVNTKFVNHLQPEWSRFVTRVKRAGNLHNVSFDQLYAYLKHNEADAREVQAMRAKFCDPLALIAKNYNPSPSYSTLAIASRYTPTNNHLRFFSNPRTQANVQEGRVIVQNVQGRHSQGCYKYKGKGHYAKKCTTKKRVKDSKWFKDKMLLAQKQEARLELDDEEQDFMADELEGFDSVYEGLQLNTTSIFMTDHVDAFDSDCDEAPISSAIFITRLSPTRSVNGDDVGPFYDTDILSEVPNYDNYHDNDMFHQFVQDLDYSEQSVSVNDTFVALTNDNHVISEIPYAGSNKNEVIQDMNSLAQNDAVILSIIENMQHEVTRMEIDVNACSMEKKFFEIEKKELSLENYRLLEESMSCDIMCTILHLVKDMDVYSVFSCMFIDKTVECEILEAQLSKLKANVENKSFNDLLKCFAKLEEYSISLKLSLQHYKEKMICNGSWKWHDASLISELKNKSYEINDLKAQLQDKSIAVNELKKLLTKLKGKGFVGPVYLTVNVFPQIAPLFHRASLAAAIYTPSGSELATYEYIADRKLLCLERHASLKLGEEHPKYYQAKGSKDEEKLVHLKMVVKFEVLIEKKKTCSLGLMGEGVVVTSSSLEMLTNSCLEGIIVSLIFLKGLEEEALVEFMVELFEEDEVGKKNEKDGLFNLKANDQSEKA